ncbi:DNA polymerase III subunit chi [Sphingomonas panacisoli]|uniref:DNA polymerase III subunit chi n=1 Tax=Sphingomonas panacisoli TaxID=1813879 RepID=A0A5B8LLJ8_9SPHN|nr:DNA polymerase III subunit chi [Sphingomonas panacisoli]QDZ09111.1 DNA polymerase III subunit chi [Sphingomonas panacisoli]
MQVDFYHLTATPLERALPSIAQRIVAGGGRLLIVSGDEGQRGAIDRLLWSYSPESFLPHGQAGGDDDASQPVLIAADVAPANEAANIALIDGEWRDAALDFERAFHFFDGDRIQEARAAWKVLADRDGVERRYWKQDDAGKWEQAA